MEENMQEVMEAPQTESPETAPEENSSPSERDFLSQDARAFREKYPEVDILELEKQPAFRRFCGSRLYKESIAELYSDYLSFTREAEKSAGERAADRYRRSTGVGGGRASSLSRAEEESLAAWNKAFPQMRMSEKEYRSR